MQASIRKTISLPKLLVHGFYRHIYCFGNTFYFCGKETTSTTFKFRYIQKLKIFNQSSVCVNIFYLYSFIQHFNTILFAKCFEVKSILCGLIYDATLAPAIEKSDYEPKTPEADASVDADTVNDATSFLETFFKLYQTATEKELAYYVSGNVLEPIGRDYFYSELVNPVFTKDGDNVKVKVAVKFLDNQTKATQVSQYELVLHKDSNWKIVG